ncbi:MAG: discoidin domain-containing protein, partial [Bacteroidaceae bacterium]|nr:discoidin domain-containing protein [Bacteroidaceae bacterium]
LSVELDVKNNNNASEKITIKGLIKPGDIEFTQEVTLNALESRKIKFDKRYFPQLIINNPLLWWPAGYGEPNLYTCQLDISDSSGQISESRNITFGIKKYTYDKNNGVFHIHINDVPVFIKGANWGMSEYMLRCRGKEYETKIRLHKEMNFNMIRNWLGSVTDEEFYEYCDKYGIMVWDDFWINSNPNLPYDLNVFNNNMMEKIKRLRNHPCIAVWCGDNEAVPEAPLPGWMQTNIDTFDGGDRYFQACSNSGGLSGSGFWGAFDQRYYFTDYPDPSSGGDGKRGWGLRTEIGTAVVPTFESIKKFMPEQDWWPINEMWNKHYFGSNAGNALPQQYIQMINEGYGKAQGIEDFCRKAQLINMVSNKAMYEGWLDHMWNDASGIMTWMGQSAYPSMVWQTYDYYYDLTGAYWGCKCACEPLHVYWNPMTEEIKVANTTSRDYENLSVEATIYNMDGKPVKEYCKTGNINSYSNTTTQAFVLDFERNRPIISIGKKVVASSTAQFAPEFVTDGDDNTRWAANKADNEWIYIDLDSVQTVGGVRLNWEAAYGKSYKIQVSDDAQTWREVFKTHEGCEGTLEHLFPEVQARYVRMLGIELGWWFGYSLWSMDVLGGSPATDGLSDVHFIRLKLRDSNGNIISENDYWRGNNRKDFTALNDLQPVNIKTTSRLTRNMGRATITATVSLPQSAPNVAFAIHIQALRKHDRERLLPAIMSDNYFTLMPGEKRCITIEFDESLLKNDTYELVVEPYNKPLK